MILYAEMRNCTADITSIYEQYIKPPGHPLEWDAVIGGEREAKPLLLLPSSDYLQRGLKYDKVLSALWNGERKSGDESADDIALLNKLAYWCNRDVEKMMESFLSSPHAQGKDAAHWKKSAERKDYLRRSAEKAARDCSNTAAESDAAYRENRQHRAKEDFSKAVNPVPGGNTDDWTPPVLQSLEDLDNYTLDDMGAAQLYADMFRGTLLYLPEYKTYWVYKNGVWRVDKGEMETSHFAKVLADFMKDFIPPAPQTDGDEAIDDEWDFHRKHYRKYRARKYRETQVKDARDALYALASVFDRQPYLFNCKNGTLDIQTRAFHPHNPDDRLSKIANVIYDPDAQCERWVQFIDEICEGNKARAYMLQKALGYALQGEANEECYFTAIGEKTRNGKGTLFDTTMNIFGDYGLQIDFNTISRSGAQDGSRATPDIARLRGVRLALANEPQKGIHVNEALLKQLTGNDDIVGRPLYGDILQFKPVFKLFVTANSKPSISDDSLFTSGRVKLLPFTKFFSEEERDTSLKAYFRTEEAKSGIFNWLLKGYSLYLEDGLGETDEMKTLAEEYRRDNDYIGQFLDECVDLEAKGTISVKQLRMAYSRWCSDVGTTAFGVKLFKEELRKHDITIRGIHNRVDGIDGAWRDVDYIL